VNPEINAMNQGRQAGMQSIPLSGLRPSAQNPRGGQPRYDPCATVFQRFIASGKELVDCLERYPMPTRPEDSVDVTELVTKAQRIAIDRQTDMVKTAQEEMATGAQNKFPNVNAMGAGVA